MQNTAATSIESDIDLLESQKQKQIFHQFSVFVVVNFQTKQVLLQINTSSIIHSVSVPRQFLFIQCIPSRSKGWTLFLIGVVGAICLASMLLSLPESLWHLLILADVMGVHGPSAALPFCFPGGDAGEGGAEGWGLQSHPWTLTVGHGLQASLHRLDDLLPFPFKHPNGGCWSKALSTAMALSTHCCAGHVGLGAGLLGLSVALQGSPAAVLPQHSSPEWLLRAKVLSMAPQLHGTDVELQHLTLLLQHEGALLAG